MFTKFKILLAFLFVISAATKFYAQDDMMMPKPIENQVFDAMVGDWTGESDMMGMKMTENMKVYWTLNHQFIVMEMNAFSKDNDKMDYSGMGIYGVDKDGNAKMWWFDDWGVDAIATGSGTFEGMMLKAKSSNTMYTEERTFEIKDGSIVSNWTSTMMGKDGKEMKMSGKTFYTKK